MNMLDELLVLLSTVCSYLLPILGAGVLIYLIIFLRKLINTMLKVDFLMDDVNKKMSKLDEPLETIVHLSNSVDNIHNASIKGVNSLIEYLVANFENILERFK